MNKQLLVMTMCAALGSLSLMAQVTIEGSETVYPSISAAMADAADGSVINVTESYTETQTITIPLGTIKNVSIIGNTGVEVSFHGIFVVSLQEAQSSLKIENVIFKDNKPESVTGRSPFAIGRGSITMKNVTIEDVNESSATGIIALNNGNSNIPSAVLDNVKIVNCTLDAAVPAEVVVNNSNVTLSGDSELSMQLKGANSIKSAAAFTGHATLVLDAARETGSVIVNECADPTLFTLSSIEDKILQVKDGNLVLAEIPAITVEGEGGAGYSDLKTAIENVESGATLVINKNISLTGSRISIGGKTLTIKGATGTETISRGQNVGYHLVSLGENDNITFENIIVDGDEAETKVPLFQTQFNAVLNLSNVKIINCKAVLAANHGLIENRNNGDGTWHLNGVQFENCVVIRPENAAVDTDAVSLSEPLVAVNLSGNSISGDNSLSLLMCGNFSVDAQGVNNTTPVKVKFTNPNLETEYFQNCSDPFQFQCTNSTYKFVADGNNLKLGSDLGSGIVDIDADNEAETVWYNLNGIRVNPDTPGLYIKVKAGKAAKVYVK